MVRALEVLLVEDDPIVARAMLRRLREERLEVELATDKTSALALDATCQVAVIDLNLPDGSGLELLDELERAGRALTPIFFSATGDPNEIASARERGKFIPKDAGVEAVVRLVLGFLTETSGELPGPASSTRPSSLDAPPSPVLEAPSSTRASSGEHRITQTIENTSDAITKTK